MDTIVERLPLFWTGTIGKLYLKYNPLITYDFVALLGEEERELNPLWIDLEKTKMCLETPVRQHMFISRTYIISSLEENTIHIVILVHAIVSAQLNPT